MKVGKEWREEAGKEAGGAQGRMASKPPSQGGGWRQGEWPSPDSQ